jgi:hypothetical protein
VKRGKDYVTNESLTQREPESKAAALLRSAADQAIAEFRRRGLPRAGLVNFASGSWSVLVSQHPEVAPLRGRFVAMVTEPFADGQQGILGGTR